MTTLATGLATSFITFSRPGASGGGATVTDADGKIKWAGHNLLLASEQFNAAQWTTFASTVTSNSATAPNGTTTADTFAADGTNNWHYLVGSASAGYPRTASFFVKKNTHDFVQILFSDDANAWANFDLANGVKGSVGTNQTESITPIGNGWYLCSVTTSSATAANVYISLVASASAARASGGTFSTSVFLWGAHLYRSDLGGMQQNPAMPAGMGSYYPTTPRNLLGYTEDFSNAYWTKENILAFGSGSVANAAVAPNGLQTADLIVPNTTNGTHRVAREYAMSSPRTTSVYAKAAGYNYLLIWQNGDTGTNYVSASFNLATGATPTVYSGAGAGAAVATATITNVGNGWYRCSLTITANGNLNVADGYNPRFGISSTGVPDASNFGAQQFAGDGVSGIYLWGAQLSDSASLDSYVPVYGAAVSSAAYYAPRLDFDPVTLAARGLLVEEQRTNLLLHTAAFDNAAWSKYEVNTTGTPAWVNVGTAPDGTATAEKIIETTVNDAHIIYRTETLTAAAYTFSVYAKAAERSILYLRLDTGGAKYAYFNLSTGATSNVNAAYTAAITPVGDGWYRCSITTTGTAASYTPVIGVTTTAGTPSYAGDGTSGVLIWGAQLEAGSFATSYIPNGSAVAGATRAADVASVSTQAFPYSASEGTIVASWAALSNSISGQSGIDLYKDASNKVSMRNSQMLVADGGVTQAQFTTGSVSTTTSKRAIAFKANDFGAAFNGVSTSPDTSGTLPAGLTALNFNVDGGTIQLNGWLQQVTYLPRRLTSTELAARTA